MVSETRTMAANIAYPTLALKPGNNPVSSGVSNRDRARLVQLSGWTG